MRSNHVDRINSMLEQVQKERQKERQKEMQRKELEEALKKLDPSDVNFESSRESLLDIFLKQQDGVNKIVRVQQSMPLLIIDSHHNAVKALFDYSVKKNIPLNLTNYCNL